MTFIQLVLETTVNGCIIPVSHKLNRDGYFRKVIGGKWKMYHRHVWEESNGRIPSGHEIDHLCKNRACCNVEHLQCLPSSRHRRKDNMERAGNFTGKPKSRRYKKEAQAEVHPDHVELYKQLAVESIVKAGQHFKLNCPLAGEAKVGRNWADTH